MDNKFGGVVWTNHAIERLRERNISQGDAWATWSRPDQSRKGSSGNWVYYKTYPSADSGQAAQRIEVVAKQNEKGEWLILSVWSRPVYGNNVQQNKSSDGGIMEKILQFFLGWARKK